MNDTTKTGATVLGGTALSGVIIYLCTLRGVTPPPLEVAGTMSASIFYGLHQLAVFISNRWPPRVPSPPPAQPALPAPTPPVVVVPVAPPAQQ